MVKSYCLVCKKETESKDVDMGHTTTPRGNRQQKTMESQCVECGKRKRNFTK